MTRSRYDKIVSVAAVSTKVQMFLRLALAMAAENGTRRTLDVLLREGRLDLPFKSQQLDQSEGRKRTWHLLRVDVSHLAEPLLPSRPVAPPANWHNLTLP